ncbi:MAG: VOC family protein [Actinomycetota bacterium]|nr:VOC family protein [Actinomycetota bacterium]
MTSAWSEPTPDREEARGPIVIGPLVGLVQQYGCDVVIVGSIVIRVDDLDRQTAFWGAALDYEVREPRAASFVLLRPRNGVGPNVSLDAHRSERILPPRIHLDLYTDDQVAEVERLQGLGAARIEWSKRPAHADYIIMEDPEGNRFCVIDTSGR